VNEREELERRRQLAAGMSERQELERRRQIASGDTLGSMRFEPPVAPAATTRVSPEYEQAVGEGPHYGLIPRGTTERFESWLPQKEIRPEMGLGEKALRTAANLSLGLAKMTPRMALGFLEQPGHLPEQAMGFLPEIGRRVRAASPIGKVDELRRTEAGIPYTTPVTPTPEERTEARRELMTEPLDVVLALAGGAAPKTLRAKLPAPPTKIKVAPKYTQVSKIKPEVPNANLVANETMAPTPAGMKPYKILRYPEVTFGEEAVMKTIPRQPVKGRIGKIGEGVENPIRMHERLGTKKLMYHPARAAENRAAIRAKTAITAFEKVRREIPLGKRSDASKRVMIHAVAQQRGGPQILAEMRITKIPELTPTEMKVYGYMRTQLEGLYNELQQTRMASGVKPFGKVENYFTFFRNIEAELQAGRPILNIDPSRVMRPKLRVEKTPFRFAKKRILDDYGPLELDAFGVFERYVNSAAHHIEMTPQIAKMRQLLDGKFADRFSLLEINPVAYEELNNWVNFISGVDVHNLPRWAERGLRKINRNLAYSVLSYNLRSAAIQPTAILNATAEIGPRWVQEGVRGLFNPKLRRFIMEKSNTLSSRQHDIAITEAMQGITGKFGGVKRKLGQAGLKPLQVLDLETAKATWWGAYQKGRKVMKMTNRQAIEFADDVVVKTQASASRVDLAPIQRSALGKTVATFQTFVINQWGFLTRDVAGIGNPKITNRQAFKKVMTWVAGATIINSIYEDALGVRSPFPAPISQYRRRLKEGDPQAKALYKAALEVGELVPIVGGGVRYGSHPAGAFAQMAYDVGKTLTQPRITPKTLETAGKVLGVPGATQMKKFQRMYTEEEEKKKKKAKRPNRARVRRAPRR